MGKKLFSKDFTLVLVGQIISLFGNGIIRFALPLYLLIETDSSTLFGLVSALSFLPMIFLMPIGGMIADRVNKRNIMVALDFITAGLMFVLFILLGKMDLVVLVVLVLMILYAIAGLYQPAVQASIPILQDKENLMQANAIIGQVSALAGLIAPNIGGILLGQYGVKPIIIIGGVCFLLSAVMELFITIPHKKLKPERTVLAMVKQDFKVSLAFIRDEKPIIMQFTGIICSINLFLTALLIVGIPILITQTLGLSVELNGYAQGIAGFGGLFGGILVGIFAKKLRLKQASLLIFILAFLLIPIALSLYLQATPMVVYYIIVLSCFGIMSIATIVSVQLLSFLQGETPPELIGKVMSCVIALSICSQPVGFMMYGYLFEVLRDSTHIIVFTAVLVGAVLAMISRKVFSRIET